MESVQEFEKLPAADAATDAETATMNSDDMILKKMGYAPSLHRGLNGIMNFAFGFTEVAVLVSVCLGFGTGLNAGGPAVLIWGFVVNWICTTIISFSMAEICGAYPSAGSVYHWAGMIVPPEWCAICSYTCGWANFLGNAAGDASFANGCAAFLSAALVISGYDAITPQDQVGTSIAIIFLWTCLNFFRVDQVGWMNNLAALVHTGAIIIIIVACLSLTPKLATGETVWAGYINNTGYTSQSYVGCIGLTAALFSFAGYEASAHMAEETSDSSTTAPKGILFTVFATGFGGFFLILAMLYSTRDPTALLETGLTGVAAADLFVQAGGTVWGAALTWLVFINFFFAGLSSVAVTGRITYALARDNAFPCSSVLKQINPALKSPINALLFVFVLDACIMLLPLAPNGGGSAFFSIVGLCALGFQVSYAIPIFLKLIFDPKDFPLTPMDLGQWSKPFGILSCCWLFGTSFFFFLVPTYPVTAESMNWLIVVVGGVFFIGMMNWIFNPIRFEGPKRTANDAPKRLTADALAAVTDPAATAVAPALPENSIQPMEVGV